VSDSRIMITCFSTLLSDNGKGTYRLAVYSGTFQTQTWVYGQTKQVKLKVAIGHWQTVAA